jgi:transposase
VATLNQILVDIPNDKGVHVKSAGTKNEKYVYKYVKYFRNENGDPRNKAVAIGKLDPDTGRMYPNSNYFDVYQINVSLPDISAAVCIGKTAETNETDAKEEQGEPGNPADGEEGREEPGNSTGTNNHIVKKVLEFLHLFMCETLAKRLLSMVLIAVGVHNHLVTELTGLCDKSVRTLKKAIDSGETDSLFRVGGGGRKRKLKDIEESIIEDIKNGNYHSQQQIADMIFENYGIKVSLPAVGRLLKKRHQEVEMRLPARKS